MYALTLPAPRMYASRILHASTSSSPDILLGGGFPVPITDLVPGPVPDLVPIPDPDPVPNLVPIPEPVPDPDLVPVLDPVPGPGPCPDLGLDPGRCAYDSSGFTSDG